MKLLSSTTFLKSMFLLINGGLIASGLIIGLLTKNSFSNLHKSKNLMETPTIQRSVSGESLNPSGNAYGIMSIRTMQDEASDIVEATFSGTRSYGYQTFISVLTIKNVYKGQLKKNQDIKVFEPLQIIPLRKTHFNVSSDDVTLKEKLAESDGKIITPSAVSSYYHGKNIMKKGARYLLFLEKKATNPKKALSKNTYFRMLDCAYSRILLDKNPSILVAQNPPTVSLHTSENVDQICADEKSKALYIQTCSYLTGQYKDSPSASNQ